MSNLDSISRRQQHHLGKTAFWILLLLCAGVPRVLAALCLPNEEGDPYSYLQAIEVMRASLNGGTFTLSELFGFWLPLYQFVCALISLVVGNTLYVAKLVSAVCGTGVCLLVFAVSTRLTANRNISLLAFALISFNPIHIMYSGFSMSDVPHALFVMSSLYFAISRRWVAAAGMVAIGGLIRPESWLFVLLLPVLQWFIQRRISLTAFFIAASSPLLWIYISWAASGNPLEYFKVRNEYIAELLRGAPGLANLTASVVLVDMRTLIYSTGPAVIVACLLGAVLIIKRRHSDASDSSTLITVTYFLSALSFLLVAYFTKNQPAIFARYCLVLFALGLPVLAWDLLVIREWKRPWMLGINSALAVLCLLQFGFQLRDGASFIRHVGQKRMVAEYLKEHAQIGLGRKIYCEDDTVRTLAGIPADSFVSSPASPIDSTSFLKYLEENSVEYLVYEKRNPSAAVRLFSELGEDRIAALFQLAASTNLDLKVYRLVF